MSELKPADKLKALGIKYASAQDNPYSATFADISAVKTFSEFNNDVQSLASFAEFEDYLVNTIGLSSSKAAEFRKRLEQKYSSWTDFQNSLSGFSSYSEWINSFNFGESILSSATVDGQEAAMGIRFHAEAGTTREGVKVPGGTLEMFGNEIHTSQTGPTADEPAGGDSIFSFSNESVSPTSTPDKGQTVTFSVDVKNTSNYATPYVPVLTVDGDVVKEGAFTKIGAGNTRTFSFDYQTQTIGDHTAKIGASAGISFTVIYPQL